MKVHRWPQPSLFRLREDKIIECFLKTPLPPSRLRNRTIRAQWRKIEPFFYILEVHGDAAVHRDNKDALEFTGALDSRETKWNAVLRKNLPLRQRAL